jgi:hypothetical protein
VKNYGKIAVPLTSLLKKNAFIWSEIATQAFAALKDDMCTTPILAFRALIKLLSWNVMLQVEVSEQY